MSRKKSMVLVVEDEPLIRMAAVQLVEDAGYAALEASNADQAIIILEAHPGIRVVFTDIDMPGSRDGMKLAHYIYDRWPPIRLIVASGKRIFGAELPKGAKFFSKPYGDDAVAQALSELLNAPQLN